MSEAKPSVTHGYVQSRSDFATPVARIHSGAGRTPPALSSLEADQFTRSTHSLCYTSAGGTKMASFRTTEIGGSATISVL